MKKETSVSYFSGHAKRYAEFVRKKISYRLKNQFGVETKSEITEMGSGYFRIRVAGKGLAPPIYDVVDHLGVRGVRHVSTKAEDVSEGLTPMTSAIVLNGATYRVVGGEGLLRRGLEVTVVKIRGDRVSVVLDGSGVTFTVDRKCLSTLPIGG